MATTEIVPNADTILIDWSPATPPSHESLIDEPRGSPNTGDLISASEPLGEDAVVDEFYMSSYSPITSASQVVVYAYCNGAATYGGNAEVGFWPGYGSWLGYQSLIVGIGWGWRNKTFSGLTMTQTNLNDCRVRFRADVPLDKQVVQIACVYAVVTYIYTPPPTGYGHDFNGVPAANISSVMGVPTANIDKINGV